jgi:hypothetical protein
MEVFCPTCLISLRNMTYSVLLQPAIPSNTMITTENPICFRYNGITGYNISLAMSVNRLTNDSIQMVRLRFDLMYSRNSLS